MWPECLMVSEHFLIYKELSLNLILTATQEMVLYYFHFSRWKQCRSEWLCDLFADTQLIRVRAGSLAVSTDLLHWVHRWTAQPARGREHTDPQRQGTVHGRGAEIMIMAPGCRGRSKGHFWLGVMVKIHIEIDLEGWEKIFLNRERSGRFHIETLYPQKPGGWMDRCVWGIEEITQTKTPEQKGVRNIRYLAQQAFRVLLENCVHF